MLRPTLHLVRFDQRIILPNCYPCEGNEAGLALRNGLRSDWCQLTGCWSTKKSGVGLGIVGNTTKVWSKQEGVKDIQLDQGLDEKA